MAFSVGFSPVSLGRSGRLTRQKGFIQKQPSATGQVSNLVNMFEKKATPNSSVNQSVTGRRATPVLDMRKLHSFQTNSANKYADTRTVFQPTVSVVDTVTPAQSVENLAKISTSPVMRKSLSAPTGLNAPAGLLNASTGQQCFDSEALQQAHLPRQEPCHTIKRKLDYLERYTKANDLRTPPVSALESKRNKYLTKPKAWPTQRDSGLKDIDREEHIYDEIGDVPYIIQSAKDFSNTCTSTPCLNSKIDNTTSLTVPEMKTAQSDSFIRHLGNSPDMLRQSSKKRRKTPVKPGLRPNAWGNERKDDLRFIEASPALRRPPKLPVPFSPHRVIPTDSFLTTPSRVLMDGSLDRQYSNLVLRPKPSPAKPAAGNTPRKLIGNIFSKIKGTPKKMKLSSATNEDDQF